MWYNETKEVHIPKAVERAHEHDLCQNRALFLQHSKVQGTSKDVGNDLAVESETYHKTGCNFHLKHEKENTYYCGEAQL